MTSGEPVAPRWWVAIAVAAMLVAPSAASAATRTAVAPLPLHVHPPGPPTAAPVSVLRGRFVARIARGSQLVVRDDGTRRRYEVSIQPQGTVSGGCKVADVRLPDALLQCVGYSPSPDAFVIAKLSTGALQTLKSPGVRQGDWYSWLGREWVRGTAPDASLRRYDAVYINRRTSQRVQRNGTDRFYDADSSALPAQRAACRGAGRGPFAVPDPRARGWLHRRKRRTDPQGDLLLMRCGRHPLLISRCPRGCTQPAFNDRVVTWMSGQPGDTGEPELVVRSIRTGRGYRRRVPDVSALAATTSRILVTREFTDIVSFDILGVQASTVYRTSEIPLPASVR